jgi:hypothetical protein
MSAGWWQPERRRACAFPAHRNLMGDISQLLARLGPGVPGPRSQSIPIRLVRGFGDAGRGSLYPNCRIGTRILS